MFMMANIIVNFIILAAYDPLHNNLARGYGKDGDASMTPQDKVQNDLEPWFQAVSGDAAPRRAAPCHTRGGTNYLGPSRVAATDPPLARSFSARPPLPPRRSSPSRRS